MDDVDVREVGYAILVCARLEECGPDCLQRFGRTVGRQEAVVVASLSLFFCSRCMR